MFARLGPLLFNILFNDLFLYPKKHFFSNYDDDDSLYAIGNTTDKVKQKDSATILESLKIGFTKS